MRYMLLIYDCDRPEPGDPRFEDSLARVNAFVEECRRRGVLRGGDPLRPESTATTVGVRDGQTLIVDGPFAEVHEQLGGYYILDCRDLDEALELAAAAALYQDGLLAFWQGADEEACSLHGRSLRLARQAGDQTLIALALCGLARVALHEDLDWARTLCEEALATVKGTDNPTARADALHVLSVTARMQGDLWQARRLMAQRIDLARELGDSATISAESLNLSVVERQPGNACSRYWVQACPDSKG